MCPQLVLKNLPKSCHHKLAPSEPIYSLYRVNVVAVVVVVVVVAVAVVVSTESCPALAPGWLAQAAELLENPKTQNQGRVYACSLVRVLRSEVLSLVCDLVLAPRSSLLNHNLVNTILWCLLINVVY